jgi:hypothetical protein
VTEPRDGDQIVSPVRVTGRATTTSGSVRVQILDAKGQELAAIDVPVSCGARCTGTFDATLAFFVPSRQRGTAEVLELGPDASTHAVDVRVELVPGV